MYIPSFAVFWATYRRTILGLLIVVLIILIGIFAGWDASLVAALAALVGIFTQAFAGFLGLLALIPWLGPLLAKALSIPLVWLVNGAGYFFLGIPGGPGAWFVRSTVESPHSCFDYRHRGWVYYREISRLGIDF